jgi:hypothetical protein
MLLRQYGICYTQLLLRDATYEIVDSGGSCTSWSLEPATCRRRRIKWTLIEHLHENSKVASGGHEAQSF